MPALAPPPAEPDPAAILARSPGINAMEYKGKWLNPLGWKGRWMWTGNVERFPPQDYIRKQIGVTRDGLPRWKLSPAPARMRRWREIPETVFVRDAKDYQEHLSRDRWLDAERDLPDELRDAILDYYGDDLTAAMRVLCARQIAERKAGARPATAGGAATSADDVTRASPSPTKPKPRARRKTA